MVRTLSERLCTHEQRRARLAEAEAKLKLEERKQRTRRLVEAGALAEKACLLSLDSKVLYGAFLSLRDGVADPKQVEHWAALGGRAFASEVRTRDEGREPLLLVFDGPLTKDVTATLRKSGFRYSQVMRHWEGLVRPQDAETLAAAYSGRVQCLPCANDTLPELAKAPEAAS